MGFYIEIALTPCVTLRLRRFCGFCLRRIFDVCVASVFWKRRPSGSDMQERLSSLNACSSLKNEPSLLRFSFTISPRTFCFGFFTRLVNCAGIAKLDHRVLLLIRILQCNLLHGSWFAGLICDNFVLNRCFVGRLRFSPFGIS